VSDECLELYEGRWRPAVPLPLYMPFHVTCTCGRRFWGLRIEVQRGRASERYEAHYRAVHIKGRPYLKREPWEHPWLPADRDGWP
jgi:hypothetical protein